VHSHLHAKGPTPGEWPREDDLPRTWADLLRGLPPIDAWTITEEFPDINALGQAFLDDAEIGELPTPVWEAMALLEKDLAEYRFGLNRARRRAAREQLDQADRHHLALSRIVDGGLQGLPPPGGWRRGLGVPADGCSTVPPTSARSAGSRVSGWCTCWLWSFHGFVQRLVSRFAVAGGRR
jgi:hypothetical protein